MSVIVNNADNDTYLLFVGFADVRSLGLGWDKPEDKPIKTSDNKMHYICFKWMTSSGRWTLDTKGISSDNESTNFVDTDLMTSLD